MWQEFTELARKAILSGQQEAVQRDSSDVDVLHLLIGTVRVDYDENWQNGIGLVSRMLTTNGVDAQSLYAHIAARLPPQLINKTDVGDPRLTREAKRVLEVAAQTARRMRSNYIGPEHLFLAVLQVPQGAFLLDDFGLDADDMQRQLSDWLRSPRPTPETKTISDELQIVLENSRREATLSGCGHVYNAHLLLAALSDESMQTLLERCEINPKTLQERIKSRLISDCETAAGQIKYSRGAKRVLDLARREADNDSSFEMQPSHLLLALSQPERGLPSRWRNLLQPSHANENLTEVLRDVSTQDLRENLSLSTDEKARRKSA